MAYLCWDRTYYERSGVEAQIERYKSVIGNPLRGKANISLWVLNLSVRPLTLVKPWSVARLLSHRPMYERPLSNISCGCLACMTPEYIAYCVCSMASFRPRRGAAYHGVVDAPQFSIEKRICHMTKTTITTLPDPNLAMP